MNAPVVLAQLSNSAATPSNLPPKNLKIEKPPGGQAVTVHLDGNTRVDFSDVASERLTFVRVGDRLVVLFDNQSTVTVEPVFDSMGRPLSDVAFDMTPAQTLTGEEFAALFPISTDQSILPAAGTPGAPGVPAGANFSNPAVDPLSAPNPLDLLGPEDFPNVVAGPQQRAAIANTVPTAGLNARIVLDEDAIPGANGNAGGNGDIDAPYTVSATLSHDYQSNGPGTIDFAAMDGTTQVINGIAVTFTWNAATNTLTGNDGAHDVFRLVLTDPVNGNFTVTLDHALLHHTGALADNVEGNNTFTLSYTVHDNDGDSTVGTVELVINDDTPTASDGAPQDTSLPGEGEGGPITVSATLDDEGQAGGNSDPEFSQLGDVPGQTVSVSGQLEFSPGADGLGAIAFTNQAGAAELKITDANGNAVSQLRAIYVDGNGIGHIENVALSWNAATGALTGTSEHHSGIGGESPVFTLTLDSTGRYIFTAFAPLAQPLVDDPSTSGVETLFEDNLTLAFTYTVTDGDGDKASAQLSITVNDDSPVAFDSAPTSSNGGEGIPSSRVSGDGEGGGPKSGIILDDEDQSHGNPGDGGNGDDGAGNEAYGQLQFSAGADGVQSISFAEGLALGYGQGETLHAMYVDTETGVGTQEAVTRYVWTANPATGGGTLQAFTDGGHYDTSPVFTLTVTDA
jgi:hypothetical protein